MKRLFSFLMFLILLAVTIWFIGFIWFIGEVPRQSLDDKPSTQKAALGVVLTGGHGRITHGLITLYEGRVSRLFITGVNENASNTDLFSSTGDKLSMKLYQRYKKQIHVGRDARSTRGNALEVKKFLKGQTHSKSILLITSNYHMPRSLHEFRRVFPGSEIIPEPVFSSQFPADWWRNQDSILLLVSEYHKLTISYMMKLLAQETQLSEILANNPL